MKTEEELKIYLIQLKELQKTLNDITLELGVLNKISCIGARFYLVELGARIETLEYVLNIETSKRLCKKKKK